MRKSILAFLLFYLIPTVVSAQIAEISSPPEEKIDEIFRDFEKQDAPGCALGIAKNGDLVFSKGYGMANLDYMIPITPSSRFMIASISKQFAAASLLMMEQEGLLDLNEDLRPRISYISHFEEPITAIQLIHHTSGIRDIYNLLSIADKGLDDTTTPTQALEILQNQTDLNFTPAEQHLYSNMAYFLISHVVEELSEYTLKEYSHKHFFEPIGMNSTHWHDNTEKIVPNRVTSYRAMPYGPGKFYRGNMDRVGARGLFTTIEDFAKWDKNFLENTSNLENFKEKMTRHGSTSSRDSINYAAGLRLGNHKGLSTIGHGGNYMGFRSNYVRFPEYGLSVFVFCNMSNINPASLARDVADLYLEEAFESKFEQYTGTFRNNNYQTGFDIYTENGKLYMKRPFEEAQELHWSTNDTFRASNRTITFIKSEDQQINSIEISTPRTSNVTFHKVGNS